MQEVLATEHVSVLKKQTNKCAEKNNRLFWCLFKLARNTYVKWRQKLGKVLKTQTYFCMNV